MATIWIFLLSAALVGLDQLTKYLATLFLAGQGGVPFIPGVLEFRYALNQGAAFSMLTGYRWLLIIVTAAALAAVLYILLSHKLHFKSQELCLIFIFSGGVGNLIDRILHGYVVDFFHTVFMEFPIFNVADSFIVIGVILLLFLMLRQELKERRKKRMKTRQKTSQTDGETNDAGQL
ncbi:MAG: signal peptidase II [Oscillospiraceae bacterium]|nr:signal peptidase II [Oscillospiraceae bacterium]